MNEYVAGQSVVVTYTLTPLADPDDVVVTWAVRNADTGAYGPKTTLRHSTGGVTRVSIGVYQVVIDTTGQSGWVVHQMQATGAVQGASIGRFAVEALPL